MVRARNHESWRKLACVILAVVLCASFAANWLAPAGYARQYREATNAGPSRTHWLGTDEIGRDRFAAYSMARGFHCLAGASGSTAFDADGGLNRRPGGYLGGVWQDGMAVTDLFLSLPWLFLLITARALMPLNVSPLISVLVTFYCSSAGWTTAARVLCNHGGIAPFGGFCPPGAGRRDSRTKIVLDSCNAELEAGAFMRSSGFRFRSLFLSEATWAFSDSASPSRCLPGGSC